jgi:hypothetical protein
MLAMSTETSPFREVHKLLATPEADYLGELYLIRADLEVARATMALYFEKFVFSEVTQDAESRIISASLFRDAILLYCSCFSTKDAHKLDPKAVYGHMDGWEPYYRKLLDLRDSFVAHNFGPQRQHNIVVVCLETKGEVIPQGYTQLFMRFGGWVAGERDRFLTFVDVAGAHLEKRIGEAEAVVTETVANLTPAQAAALPDGRLMIPEDSDFRLSRTRFRDSGRGERMPLPRHRWFEKVEPWSDPHRSGQQPSGPDEEAPPTEPEPAR